MSKEKLENDRGSTPNKRDVEVKTDKRIIV
jgi:hypothetical protein